jgi:hypothetical protein
MGSRAHDDADVGARVAHPADQGGCLVGRDATADTDDPMASVQTRGVCHRVDFLGRVGTMSDRQHARLKVKMFAMALI